MNNNYLYRAKQQIQDPQILSIVAGKRAKMLAHGARPMIKTNEQEFLDIALLEIAEGLLSYEFPTKEELAEEKARLAAAIAEQEAEEAAQRAEAQGETISEDVANAPEDIDFGSDSDFEEIVDFENMEAFPEMSDFVDIDGIDIK